MDTRSKVAPTLVQYLINKGQSEADISTYLGLTVAQLRDYTYDGGGCTEVAIEISSFLGGWEGKALEGGEANGMDEVLEEGQV